MQLDQFGIFVVTIVRKIFRPIANTLNHWFHTNQPIILAF